MIIFYVAQRSLFGTHVAGTQYTLDIGTTVRQRSRRVEKVQQKALSGRMETLWFYGERAWSITFEPVHGNDVLELQEFLDSTESGELFAMALHGPTAATVNVKRTDDGYQLATFMEMGALDEDWLQASIEVIEQ